MIILILKIGARVKELRYARGLTQDQFGQRLGLSRAVISSYERETRIPPHDIIVRIALVFRVPIDYIYGIDIKQTIDASGLDSKQYMLIMGIIENMRELNQHKEKENK